MPQRFRLAPTDGPNGMSSDVAGGGSNGVGGQHRYGESSAEARCIIDTSTRTLVDKNCTSTSPVDRSEQWPDIGRLVRHAAARLCSTRHLSNRLPIIRFARTYKRSDAYQDFVAGLTVGLTAIPQGIAYAVVAGLPPQYGLYSELLASFVYCILGSSRNVTIGPTAIMALMVQRFALMSPDFAVFVSFICGIIIITLGLLSMGSLVQFISMPVTAGFTTAAALQIGSLQVKSLLGLPGRSTEFLDAWIHIFKNIGGARLWDSVLGVLTIGFLLALKRLGECKRVRYAGLAKYISLGRNALAVFIGSLIAYFLQQSGYEVPFALTGEIKAGFPPFQIPPMQTIVDNQTLSFTDMLETMGSALAAIPLIAILEVIVVAKSFAQGRPVDATQEIIALGCCNLLGCFVSSMPVTGSFTRTAVNSASGSRTPFGGIVTGVLVLLSVSYLTSTFRYIPKATLAAIIITAMVFMMEFHTAKRIWRTRRLDIIPFVATMLSCLFIGLDYGICIGILVNVAFIMYASARPTIEAQYTKVANQTILLIAPDQSLVFAAAEHLRHKVLKLSCNVDEESDLSHVDDHNDNEPTAANANVMGDLPSHSTISVVVLDGAAVRQIDVTVAENLQLLADDLRARNQTLLFWNWPQQPTNVAWRHSAKLGALFHMTESLTALMQSARVHCYLR